MRHRTTLCAILALASSEPAGRVGAVALVPLGADFVGADHLDLIAQSDHAQACVLAINEFLRRSSTTWSEMRFPLVTETSDMGFGSQSLGAGFRKHTRLLSGAPYLTLEGDFESYLQTLSANERHKLRSRSRKVLARPGVSYCSFTEGERGVALQRLFELHRARASMKAAPSSFAPPEVESFHRRLLERLPWDRVVLRGLRSGSDVFAMFYGFRFGGRLFYFQLGYDPQWSSSSPGLVLLTQAIKEAFETGCIEFNFLQGEEPFKKTWTHTTRSLFGCRIYSNTPRGWLSYQATRARGLLSGLSKRRRAGAA